LKYLSDAVDQYHREEDEYIETFVLERPLPLVSIIFITVWHVLFGVLYSILIYVTLNRNGNPDSRQEKTEKTEKQEKTEKKEMKKENKNISKIEVVPEEEIDIINNI